MRIRIPLPEKVKRRISPAWFFLPWPIFFFCAGLWEMKKAEETGSWPAYPAKITSAEVVTTKDSDGDPGSYMDIKGKFLDTCEPFTANRWAYGAVNGLSPHQPYLAPYKPGYLTTVYVDPADHTNIILCNDPSLTGNLLIMGGSAAVVVGMLCWLLYGRKK